VSVDAVAEEEGEEAAEEGGVLSREREGGREGGGVNERKEENVYDQPHVKREGRKYRGREGGRRGGREVHIPPMPVHIPQARARALRSSLLGPRPRAWQDVSGEGGSEGGREG